ANPRGCWSLDPVASTSYPMYSQKHKIVNILVRVQEYAANSMCQEEGVDQRQPSCHCRAFADVAGWPYRFVANDRIPCGDASQTGSAIIYNKDRTQFDLHPHMESDRWPQIYMAIQQHLQKLYNGKKAALKKRYWIPEEDATYDVERIRCRRPSHISEMESLATREYMSLIHTFFLTHTVSGVLLNPVNKALYDKMLRLQCLGSNTPSDRGYIPSVGRVLPKQGTVIPPSPPCMHSSDLESQPEYGGGSRSGYARMMRTASRMGRMRAIVRRCWIKLVILVNIDLYLADNASFVTSSPVLFEY
nr:hypothetical protein [Tanacetum cinerariifolium]